MIPFVAIKGAEPCLRSADISFKCRSCLPVGVKLLKHVCAHVIQKLHQTVCEQSLRGATEMSKATLLFWIYFIQAWSLAILRSIFWKFKLKKDRSTEAEIWTVIRCYDSFQGCITLFCFWTVLNIRIHNYYYFFLHFGLKFCFALYLDQLHEQTPAHASSTMTKKDWRLHFHMLNLDFEDPWPL